VDDKVRREIEELLLAFELAIDRSAPPREPTRWERALKDAGRRFADGIRRS